MLINCPRLQDVQLKLLTDYPLDTWWFLRLKQYLETFKQPGVFLNLQLQIESSMVSLLWPLSLSLDAETINYFFLWGFIFSIILHGSIIQHLSFNMQVEFNPELLSEQSICPLTNFKHLRFLHIESSQNHRDIIDGILWTIHPEMISVKLLSQPDSALIKVKYFVMSDG